LAEIRGILTSALGVLFYCLAAVKWVTVLLCIEDNLDVLEPSGCESVYADEFRGSGCDDIVHEGNCPDCV
jgi:hypothetical protein